MKIIIEATQEEVKELLQAIGSSKEQLNIDEIVSAVNKANFEKINSSHSPLSL